jgi:hypothetical protein
MVMPSIFAAAFPDVAVTKRRLRDHSMYVFNMSTTRMNGHDRSLEGSRGCERIALAHAAVIR